MRGYDGPGKSLSEQLVAIGVRLPEAKNEISRLWDFLLSPLLRPEDRTKRQAMFLEAQARFLGKRVRRVRENSLTGTVKYLDIKRNHSFYGNGRPELNTIFEAYINWENGTRGYVQLTMIEPIPDAVT